MRNLLAITGFALAAFAAPASAQLASFQTFGQGCTVSGLTLPTIGATGLPQIGTSSFSIDYSGPSRATWPTELRPAFMYGLSQANLPLDGFFNSQPVGCTLYLNPLDIILMPAVGINFASSVPFNIPNNPTLIGWSFFAQWACINQTCLVTGCNVNAVLTSDAASVTIGL